MKSILLNFEMVRIILKTEELEILRVIEPQPPEYTAYLEPEDIEGKGWLCISEFEGGEYQDGDHWVECPHGQVGDKLWGKEIFRSFPDGDVFYKADFGDSIPVHSDDEPENWKWRPPIFMPKWASRITLEITDIQVERVRDITEEGAITEGTEPCGNPIICTNKEHIHSFQILWDSINGKMYARVTNPWVFVIKFRRIEQ